MRIRRGIFQLQSKFKILRAITKMKRVMKTVLKLLMIGKLVSRRRMLMTELKQRIKNRNKQAQESMIERQ